MTSQNVQILKNGLKPFHQLLGEYLLQRPQATLRELSAFFGYSPSWICQVMGTDMFKAYMAERMKDVQATVTQDVPAKMAALAHLSIERMSEVLEKTGDGELILDSFDKVMHRYGYAPNAKNAVNAGGPAIGQQNNIFYLDQQQFRRVQEKLINAHAQPAEQSREGEGVARLPEPVDEKV